MEHEEVAAVNRAYWDALAAVHGEGRDAYYDLEALVAGRDSLSDAEDAAVGDVAGLDVLHVQCHIGFDSVSLTRRGARVTGVDFSPASLAKARAVAERSGVSVDFVQADAVALPDTLSARFDVAYATIGVICWIDDLRAWMRSVAGTLRPGGRLVLVEIHPLFNMIERLDPLALDFPYGGGEARRFDEDGSYADPDVHLASTEQVSYAHSLGDVAGAALAAGLRIERLEEHMDAAFDPRGLLPGPEEDGRHRLRVDGELLPVLFTLVASRP
ncbi:MAG TPA: class I SAM-dependent methyltransferase [Solirubrobacteraceae bacterium]|nr:class I SAM-dependent methyltransferase [Solirubrobacteraceae bacterium]